MVTIILRRAEDHGRHIAIPLQERTRRLNPGGTVIVVENPEVHAKRIRAALLRGRNQPTTVKSSGVCAQASGDALHFENI